MIDSASQFLVSHCPLGLSLHLLGGEFVTASPACMKLFGQSEEQLLGRSLFELVSAADLESLGYHWKVACETGETHSVRFRYQRVAQEFSTIWIEATIGCPTPTTQSVSGSGSPQLVLCTRDVTAEVVAEQARSERLEQAEQAERHRDALSSMIPGLVWFGPVSSDLSSYRVTYINEYLFRITGYTAKQWLETPGFWRSIIHPDDRERILREVARAGLEERTLGPYRILASDGRVMWLQSQMRIERDGGGVPVRMYGLTLDMTTFKQQETDRTRALERVEVLKQRMDALVETLPGIVWEHWIDREKQDQNFCSDFVLQLTGYSREEWLAAADGWLGFVPDATRADVTQALDRIVQQGAGSFQHKLKTRDGRLLWIENHVVALRDAKGHPVCLRGVALDITTGKQAEQERLSLERSIAQQAQHLLELSTPLIPVSEDVLVMPLIGSLDPARAEYSLETLLQGVKTMSARYVLVDLTGISTVDASGAVALGRMVKAVRLLGAQVLLTGMRAEIAKAIHECGEELAGMKVHPSLRSAIAEYVTNRRSESRSQSRGLRALL